MSEFVLSKVFLYCTFNLFSLFFLDFPSKNFFLFFVYKYDWKPSCYLWCRWIFFLSESFLKIFTNTSLRSCQCSLHMTLICCKVSLPHFREDICWPIWSFSLSASSEHYCRYAFIAQCHGDTSERIFTWTWGTCLVIFQLCQFYKLYHFCLQSLCFCQTIQKLYPTPSCPSEKILYIIVQGKNCVFISLLRMKTWYYFERK